MKTGQYDSCCTLLLVIIEGGNYVGDDGDDCIGDDVDNDDVPGGEGSSKC